MSNRKQSLTIILAVLLALLLAACGGSETVPTAVPAESEAVATAITAAQTEAAPATNTPQPAAEPTDTPVVEDEEPADVLMLEDAVDSYRARGSFGTTTTDAEGVTSEETLDFESAYTKADNAYGFNMSMTMSGLQAIEDDPDVPEKIEMFLVDDAAYIGVGEQWLTSTREESGMEDIPSFIGSPDEMVGDLSQLTREGKEKVNGIDTVHYSFDDPIFFSEFFGAGADEADVSNVRGDVWVAEKGDFVVKVSFSAAASGVPSIDDAGNEVVVDQEVSWGFEVTEIDGDVEITVPEGAPKPGQVDLPGFEPGEFPIPPDTQVVNSFPGLVSATSGMTQEEVTQFFDDELAKLGWTKVEGFLPAYTKGAVNLTLLISPMEDGSGVDITIFAE